MMGKAGLLSTRSPFFSRTCKISHLCFKDRWESDQRKLTRAIIQLYKRITAQSITEGKSEAPLILIDLPISAWEQRVLTPNIKTTFRRLFEGTRGKGMDKSLLGKKKKKHANSSVLLKAHLNPQSLMDIWGELAFPPLTFCFHLSIQRGLQPWITKQKTKKNKSHKTFMVKEQTII